jgi:hypothetical protein
MEFTKLSERAVQVKLTIKRAALTKRNKDLTEELRTTKNDNALKVSTELFKDRNSPIRKIMRAVNDVYAYHYKYTQPHTDAGPRLLHGSLVFEYTQEIKNLIAKAEGLLAYHMPHYNQYVLDDIAMRNNTPGVWGRANIDEYPTREQFEQAMSIEYQLTPMPDERHFLFDISEEEIEKFRQAEREVIQAAAADTVSRMLKPIAALTKRLGEYEGRKGEKFRSSLIQNILEGCDLAQKLSLNPTPELMEEIDALRAEAKQYLDGIDTLKASPHARAQAQAKLDAIASKMAMFG